MTVLKRSPSGLELELQLLDNNGRIVNRASEFIKEVKKENKQIDIANESLESMFELRSLPKVKLKESMPRLFDELGIILEKANKLDLKVFGLGSYPGSFEEKLVNKKRYRIVSSIFLGKPIFALGHCAGFHYHYAMPKGVFDKNKFFLKKLFESKTKKSLIDSYNLLIAVDPAIATLCQSSPFVNRKFLAKDSRMLLLRNCFELNYPNGLFSNLPKFGELPGYIFTMQDLRYNLLRLDKNFKDLLKKTIYKKEIPKKKLLDFVWTAVKVNKVGSLEQRGMDMNHPKYFAGMAIMLKSIQRIVQQDFYTVEVSDIAIKEPFKVEGKKILVPPQSYVKFKLQPASAYKGFDDRQVFNYVKRFYNFAKKYTNKNYLKLLNPIKKLIDRKKTVSDILINRVKKNGYSLEEIIPQKICAEIALKHARQFEKEVFKIKKIIPE